MTAEPAGDLLLDVQRRIEHLYALDPGEPVTDFLIPEAEARAYPGRGSRTLLREDGDSVSLAVVFEPAVAERLTEADPRVRLHAGNLDAFCTLIEEVSHFVYLLFCARAVRSVTELELELQGEVDKYLTAARLLSLQNEGALSPGLRAMLFRHYHLQEGVSAEQSERYRAASDMAFRYCGFLERSFLRPGLLAGLVREARRFYRLGQREKLEKLAHIP
ncbi:MAG TPA: hypothetical protein VJU18_12085 [Vicinamibacteria bacterium]|nr:hypothetical protein [Vicinamibacteria bacterium]